MITTLAALAAAIVLPQVQVAAPAALPAPAPVAAAAAPIAVRLPTNTMIELTPVTEITSIDMKEGDIVQLQVAREVTENGRVFIPRGSPVQGTIIWRTGKGIGGKSAKFDVRFDHVTVGGQQYPLRGQHRQEGRGNTAAALLGSIFISGKSAVMTPGQIVNGFTASDIAL